MIDHHVHLGVDYKLKFELKPFELSRRLNKYNLTGAIIFPCPNVLLKERNPYEKENKEILLATQTDKRFVPFMMIHPLRDRLEYLTQNHEQFKGFKIYPRSRGMEYSYLSIQNSKISDFLANSEKPIIFHTGYRESERIKTIFWFAEKSKGPVVFTHSGDLIEEDLKIASRYSNVFIDLSPLATMISNNFFVSEERRAKELRNLNIENIISYLTELFGKEKVVWGSDSPWCDHLINNGYKKELGVLEEMKKKGLTGSFL